MVLFKKDMIKKKIWFHVVQAGLKLHVYLKLAVNFWFSCIHLLSGRILGMCGHYPVYSVQQTELKALC